MADCSPHIYRKDRCRCGKIMPLSEVIQDEREALEKEADCSPHIYRENRCRCGKIMPQVIQDEREALEKEVIQERKTREKKEVFLTVILGSRMKRVRDAMRTIRGGG